MCEPMSGIITRKSVLWDEWSDSHSDILERAGIVDDDSRPDFVKFELVPPDGDYSLPFEKWEYQEDQDCMPEWYNRGNAEAEAKTVLPLWAKTHLITEGGTTVDLSGIKNPSIVVLANVTITGQRGGAVWFHDSSTGTSKGQQGGAVRFCDSSTGTSKGQRGGEVWFHDSSTGTSKGQRGGVVQFFHSSTGTSKGQRGGAVWFCGSSTGTSKGQRGGVVQFYGGSTGTSEGQQGGEVRFFHSSTGTSKGQRGGVVQFYGGSTGTSKGQRGGEKFFFLTPG